jgi:predicted nucleic acid-binding protein
MPATDPFFDSNVILYLTSSDIEKAAAAEAWLANRGVVSVQVLNEVAEVARRKFKMEWHDVRAILSVVRRACRVESVSAETHDYGLQIAERHGFGVYDSMVMASAIQAGCSTLLSEDLRHGQKIGSVAIRNPFL